MISFIAFQLESSGRNSRFSPVNQEYCASFKFMVDIYEIEENYGGP